MPHERSLQQKLGFMAVLYVISILANLAISTVCIVIYFRTSFADAEAALTHQQQVAELRTLFRQEQDHGTDAHDPKVTGYDTLLANLQAALAHHDAERWRDIESAVTMRHRLRRQHEPDNAQLIATYQQLDHALDRAEHDFAAQRDRSITRATDVQRTVVTVMTINTVIGAGLCLFGLWFVRRWVVRPVDDLQRVMGRLKTGDFSHRVAPRFDDELGRLGREINQMSSRIAEMQARLIDQARWTAAADMMQQLHDNIQPSLDEIRGLTRRQDSSGSNREIEKCQQQILNTLDQFENWLGKLQDAVTTGEPKLQHVALPTLLNDVVDALQPVMQNANVNVDVEVPADLEQVHVDELQFKQAVVALVNNAIDASPPGSCVRVSAKNTADEGWQLTVKDEGEGIAAELREKILLPFFTTKRDGNGIGLPMTNAVVRAHGGKLTVESIPGKGSSFTITMP